MERSSILIVNKPIQEDFKRFYEINSDPDTNLFNPYGAMDVETAKNTFHKMINHWEENGFGTWSISERDNPGFIIGFGGLSHRLYGSEYKLNLGYRFDKKYWGKGYAGELAKIAIAFGLHELHKNEIFAIVRPKHLVSIKILEKCNMKLVERLDDVPNEENSLIYKISK